MKPMMMFASKTRWGALALLVLGLNAFDASAATLVVRNEGPGAAQLGFDGNPSMAISPRATARFTLNPGEHTSQCRFEGIYDGCNLEERFTVGTANEVPISLRPVLTLQHAVALAREGAMRIETKRDTVWATTAQDVAGAAPDCVAYEQGRLAAVSRRVPSNTRLLNVTMATQNLCGERRAAIASTVNGAQLYFLPRFLIFRDSGGRPVLVRP